MRKRWPNLHNILNQASTQENEESKAGSGCDQGSPVKREGKPLRLDETEPAAILEMGGPKQRLTTIQDLDAHCLSQILERVHEPPPYSMSGRWEKLQACSLVCLDWLDASNFCQKTVAMRGGQQAANLPRVLSRFPNILGVEIEDVQGVAVDEGQKALPGIPSSLDDVPLELLVSRSRRLVCLNLVRCSAVSTAGLAGVLKGCRELKKLYLSFCGGFSGAVFAGVRSNLDTLELYRSGELTSAGLGIAAKACPSLYTLKLRRNPTWARVDLSEGVGKFATFCPDLMILHVEACGITDATLRSFAVRCPCLFEVRVRSMNRPLLTLGLRP